MIAKKKYCEIILNDHVLLGNLIKKDGGVTKPDTIIRNLQRASQTIRKSAALIEVLKEAGIEGSEIFEIQE